MDSRRNICTLKEHYASVAETIDLWISTKENQDFKPVILVTGCGSGIGWALAKILYRNPSYRVIATARESSLCKLRETFIEDDRFWIRTLDVTSEFQRQNLIDEIQNKWGAVNVLVNNAGISYRSVVEKSFALLPSVVCWRCRRWLLTALRNTHWKALVSPCGTNADLLELMFHWCSLASSARDPFTMCITPSFQIPKKQRATPWHSTTSVESFLDAIFCHFCFSVFRAHGTGEKAIRKNGPEFPDQDRIRSKASMI